MQRRSTRPRCDHSSHDCSSRRQPAPQGPRSGPTARSATRSPAAVVARRNRADLALPCPLAGAGADQICAGARHPPGEQCRARRRLATPQADARCAAKAVEGSVDGPSEPKRKRVRSSEPVLGTRALARSGNAALPIQVVATPGLARLSAPIWTASYGLGGAACRRLEVAHGVAHDLVEDRSRGDADALSTSPDPGRRPAGRETSEA